eukprot:TRINITY_DN64089_c0_g1_i1.p1 TRINITY_DN64089_c0_g1~~TRINITY_DN64089_c0_g1_i1.p1  ORF type:complete len:285 (+),score=49.71 TRINITY_DN64089_c0_g1_i1:112-966(+)
MSVQHAAASECADNSGTNSRVDATAAASLMVSGVSPPSLEAVHLDVMSLGGNLIFQSVFTSRDFVVTVKEAIQKSHGWPVWQQHLTWQGLVLEDTNTLGDLGLPMDGARLEIVLREGTCEDSVAYAKWVLKEGKTSLAPITAADISELYAMKHPPDICLRVCLAAQELLGVAPRDVHTHEDGNLKIESWIIHFQPMLGNPYFLYDLGEVLKLIEQGLLDEERIQGCRTLLENLDPEDFKKAPHACHKLSKGIMGIICFYDRVAVLMKQVADGVTFRNLVSRRVR